MKIFLVGMPGSGKTTLGEQVATTLRIPFVDLDHEIENHEGKSVPEIFRQQGENYFRELESTLLRQWAAKEDDFVMSTGGGAPCFFDGMKTINENGISIFLDVPLDVLIERTKRNTHRPLLASNNDEDLRNRLSDLLTKREAVYRNARFTLSTPTLSNVLDILQIKK